MRIFTFASIFFLGSGSLLMAQPKIDCTSTGTDLPPINDLSGNYWNGWMGGLYPNGMNDRPAVHDSCGLMIAGTINPLDSLGNIDSVSGKVGFISIGMSNTYHEFSSFISLVDSMRVSTNPYLQMVNCAQGGFDVDSLSDIINRYWQLVDRKLDKAILDKRQVQIIWLKTAELGPSGDENYIDTLKNKLRKVVQNLSVVFPNLKLCFLSSRIYAGYTLRKGNPEPYAYYSGWSIKKLIQEQLQGNPALDYHTKKAPWLSWGPYLWADGTNQRKDGLIWQCPDDFMPDGVHPSRIGAIKVAQMLLNFFTNDATTQSWFLKIDKPIQRK